MRPCVSIVVAAAFAVLLVATSEPRTSQPGPSSSSSSSTAAPATPATAAASVEVAAASEASLRAAFPDAAAFEAAHATQGEDPVAVVTLWLKAARLATDSGDVGTAGLTGLTVDGVKDPDWLTRSSYATFRGRLSSHPHVFRSYFEGAEPDNAYTVAEGAAPRIARSEASGEDWQVALESSGADSPRSLTLKRGKDGRWYVHRFANVYVDVRPPRTGDEPF